VSATPPAALPQDPATAAALDLLLHRYSTGPKYLRDPGPTDADVRVLAHAALRAPDHEKRVPFRFVVVRGEAKARLADLFEAYGRRRGKPADELPAERDRAERPPVVIGVLARIDPADAEVPVHEQWIAVGGAIAYAMHALQLLGYAGKVLSGVRAGDPEIAAAFCAPGETLVGWIAAGTPSTPPRAREPDDPDAIVREWR
jgi:nitroreductase